MYTDAIVSPTCIDIIYILHVYLSLCVITIYCKCVSTNKYCLLSIVFILTKSVQSKKFKRKVEGDREGGDKFHVFIFTKSVKLKKIK